jgi:hypothetical protein
MPDRFFFPLLALATIAVIALALVWPQGLGERSPAPFGHDVIQRSPEMQAKMRRETAAAQRRVDNARQAVRSIQNQALTPNQ